MQPMPEGNNFEEFQRYLAEKRGKPIDPDVETKAKQEFIEDEAKRELELGEKGGYPVYKAEADKAARLASFPEGELEKTDMTPEELQKAIAELTEARQPITKFLESDFPGFEDTEEKTLDDLEAARARIPEEVERAVSILAKHDFEAGLSLYEVPEEIRERIRKYELILAHQKKKSPEA